jgi:hypothetical protein
MAGLMYKLNFHFLPVNSLKIALPIFRCTPALEVGIPVSLAIRCLNCVMPNARFHEKLRPGMGVDFLDILEDFTCTTLLGIKIPIWLWYQFII